VGALTTKQRLFVEAYLANPNATEAARRAGYAGSDNVLAVTGNQLLRNPKIQELVEERVTEAGLTADEILNELAEIATGDYTLYRGDKVKSLELLGKYRKLFTDKSEVSGPNGGPQEHVVKGVKIELTDE
jgi:phage terminase small subunit